MKKSLLFAAALVAASAMAQPNANIDISKVQLNSEQLHQLVQAKKAVKAQAKSSQKVGFTKDVDANSIMIGFNGNRATTFAQRATTAERKIQAMTTPSRLAFPYDTSSARRAKNSVAKGAFYRLDGGIYPTGETWTSYEELVELADALGISDPSVYPNGIYLSFINPWLYTQCLNDSARFVKVAGNAWTINDNDMNQYLSDPKYFKVTEVYGALTGAYYAPTISNSKSASSYFFGSDGGGASYAVICGPNHAEGIDAASFGVYNMYDAEKVYTGYSNTYAYGSRAYESQGWGGYVESDMTIIDLGYTGGGLVIDRIDAMAISESTDSPVTGDVEEGHFIGATLVDVDPVTGEATYYQTYLAENDGGIMKLFDFSDSGASYSLHFTFVEVDEEGFESEISPVLNGYAYLILYNFMDENVDCGIYMTYNGNEDGNGNLDNQTHSYFDVWLDGVQQLSSDGSAGWYGEDETDAVVNLFGYFNCFRNYADGATEITVEIPAEGGWAVSAIDEDDGTVYNDIDVVSSFPIDAITIEDYPEWLEDEEGNLYLSYSDKYFAEDESTGISNVLMFYVGAEALPAGETGRQGDVVLRSNDQVNFIIHVVQGSPAGIKSIQNDAVGAGAIYNLQGVKVGKSEAELPAGVYVKNGKKFVK
jgi:hypothetical protein